jgi:hypothetical protein
MKRCFVLTAPSRPPAVGIGHLSIEGTVSRRMAHVPPPYIAWKMVGGSRCTAAADGVRKNDHEWQPASSERSELPRGGVELAADRAVQQFWRNYNRSARGLAELADRLRLKLFDLAYHFYARPSDPVVGCSHDPQVRLVLPLVAMSLEVSLEQHLGSRA